MNYAEYLWNRNRKYRITVCFDDGHQAIGYGDLPQNIRGTAGWLQAQGVKPYDRVLLQMEDCTELPVLIMGCHWLGAVPVLAHPDQKLPADLPPIKLTITDPDQFELADDVKIPFMKPTNECAVKFISSGTQGQSRIISWSVFAMCFTANKLYQRLNNNHKICCDYQLAVDFSIAFFNSRSALQGSQQILSIFAKFAFASSIFPS